MRPRRGDLILVSRRRTLRSFLAGPLGWIIATAIQRHTQSRWNHVACVVRDDAQLEVVEAEFRGVVQSTLEDYFKPWKYELAVVPAPDSTTELTISFNVEAAVDFWRGQIGGSRKYDVKWILMIAWATVLYGPSGLRKLIAGITEKDDFWICSELAADGWGVGGWLTEQVQRVIAPSDFATRPLSQLSQA